jgi:aspartyl protease family protein
MMMTAPPDPRRRPAAPPPHRRARLSWVLGLALFAALAVLGLALMNPTRTLTAQDWAQVGYGIGFIVLVASSLAARQLQLGQVIRQGLIWLALFALLLTAFSLRNRFDFVARWFDGAPAAPAPTDSRPLEITLDQAKDGRFYVTGAVNDVPVRFQVDPDASDIALNPSDARRIGVDVARLRYDTHFETADGVGEGAAFRAATLSIGPAHLSHVAMWINRTPMLSSLLGLNFLQGLESYQVRGSRLYLFWRP